MENPELTQDEIDEIDAWMDENSELLKVCDDHSKEKYRGEFAVIRMLEAYPEMKEQVCVNCGKSKVHHEKYGIKVLVCECGN